MDLESRLELIKQVGEEIVTEEELRGLLQAKPHPIAYDGFEPSGTNIHIAQGLLRAINTNKMTKAGVKFKFLVADWHAWANNKMGGDLEKIQTVGKYFIEVWKSAGMELDKVEFVWASDFVKDDNYWKKVMQVARSATVNRIVRCVEIMGRKENEALQASQIIYPCMQTADIFHMKADIVQLGMDQRKVNVLAREVGPALGLWKPVVVSHHMLMGLGSTCQLPTRR
jgi:tyrosyl-tRNA synthetase